MNVNHGSYYENLKLTFVATSLGIGIDWIDIWIIPCLAECSVTTIRLEIVSRGWSCELETYPIKSI